MGHEETWGRVPELSEGLVPRIRGKVQVAEQPSALCQELLVSIAVVFPCFSVDSNQKIYLDFSSGGLFGAIVFVAFILVKIGGMTNGARTGGNKIRGPNC